MTNSFLSFLIPELWKAVGGFGPITIHNVSLLFSIIDSLSKPFENVFLHFGAGAWWPLERVVWPLSWSMTGLKSIRAKWGPKVSDSRTGRGRRGVRTRARAVPRSTFRCPMLIARESRPAGRSSAPGSPSRSTGGFGTVWRGDAGSGYGPGEGTCSVGGGRMLSSGAVRTHSGQFSPPPRCG